MAWLRLAGLVDFERISASPATTHYSPYVVLTYAHHSCFLGWFGGSGTPFSN